ncbi:MAG: hypothetical protein KatS3mg033_2411 [Thermonema sp.]|nr:MAG: hypothetical protein KatS3mg033_2411 [Thermonema sp.]
MKFHLKLPEICRNEWNMGITLNFHKFRKIFQYILFPVMLHNVGILM